jgi:hypothetical protein
MIAQDTCVRSTPTPIVKKSVFPNTSFVLKKTNNRGLIISEGIETVKLNNGDRLTITNSGCEFLTLNFRFETNRRSKNSQDPKYLYQRSARLMRQIVGGLNSPIDSQLLQFQEFIQSGNHIWRPPTGIFDPIEILVATI